MLLVPLCSLYFPALTFVKISFSVSLYLIVYFRKSLPKILTNLYNERACIWLQFLPVSVDEWMFKNSLACIHKFVESDDEIRVMCNIRDIVCWECGMLRLWDIWDVGCSGCGMLGMWDVRNVPCWGYVVFGMRNVQDVEYSGCEMFGMWNVQVVVCSGSGMFGMWDAGNVRCLGCGMFGVWNVRDVGCFRFGVFRMWDVRCGMFAWMWHIDLQNALNIDMHYCSWSTCNFHWCRYED